MPGIRYIVQTDQKLMKRRKRKAKGKHCKKEMVYEVEVPMTEKDSDVVLPMVASYSKMG